MTTRMKSVAGAERKWTRLGGYRKSLTTGAGGGSLAFPIPSLFLDVLVWRWEATSTFGWWTRERSSDGGTDLAHRFSG